MPAGAAVRTLGAAGEKVNLHWYFKVGLAVAVALCSLTLAVLGLRGLDPSVAAQPDPWFSLRLGAGFDEAAQQDLQVAGPGASQASAKLTWQALLRSPDDAAAWLRLAYIDDRQNGHLGEAGLQALRRSYQAAKFDQYVDFWRIKFCLDNWSALPADVKELAHAEAFTVASEPGHRYNLKKTLLAVSDPSGLLIAMLWLGQIDRMSDH